MTSVLSDRIARHRVSVRLEELNSEADRRVERDTRDEMHLELIGLTITDKIEMVRHLSRKWKPSPRYLQARVIVIIEPIDLPIAVRGSSRYKVVVFDVRRAVLVDSRVRGSL